MSRIEFLKQLPFERLNFEMKQEIVEDYAEKNKEEISDKVLVFAPIDMMFGELIRLEEVISYAAIIQGEHWGTVSVPLMEVFDEQGRLKFLFIEDEELYRRNLK